MADEELTASIARELLDYNPATGLLFWKVRKPNLFDRFNTKPEAYCKTWNKRYANKPAFTAKGTHGYFAGAILKHQLTAHRVIWLLHFGYWPKGEIDHIDGDRGNNRISNLRTVDRLGNCQNLAKRRNNTSGTTGVTWMKRQKYWRASIGQKRKHIIIGMFEHKSDAIEARKAAELKYGFHPNHGRSQ